MKKVLIIRFSSIGDIVLTTPIIRCLKMQVKDVEIHYLTKMAFTPILKSNPYIDKIHSIEKDIHEVIPGLKSIGFDHIIDLHKNLRSLRVKVNLRKQSSSFNKLNLKKWILVRFKINMLPDKHIVDRYFDAVDFLGVRNDGKGLDYFIAEEDQVDTKTLPDSFKLGYIGFAIGGKHKTKLLPVEKIEAICHKLNRPVVLLGGKEDENRAIEISKTFGPNVYNTCGRLNINQSASIIEQAELIITHDTGLMHIAAAFRKKIISVWGNTIPEFGMYPYMPEKVNNRFNIVEVKELSCRPCSKIGYDQCPKGHFDCMNQIDVDELVNRVNVQLRSK
ncbi:MAG: glycosyltransferase family 9 protein [Bacteroidales bacterium]|nr:glycosyltransferase family 9 protein [Bacteroidales bacterium]